jgi:two-component system LytT family response regulator
VKRDGSIAFVKHADIDWIEAADYCTRLHARHATHLLRRSLADLEAELDPAEFCRIHRSIIVRLERVSRLEPSESGEFDVVLEDGVRLPVSRRHRHEVQSRLIRHRGPGSAPKNHIQHLACPPNNAGDRRREEGLR